MRIIFSRKGIDTAAGGGASPILDGRPLSLPIPTGRYPGGRRYGDLAHGHLIAAATGGRSREDDLCHFDPDIDRAALAVRPAGWRGAFGQVAAAQGHLRNEGVGAGDLFLFFGLFRTAERDGARLRFTGPARHAVFGWLRVGAVASGEFPCWLAAHPHAAPGWPASNAIYLAADRLDLPGAAALPGSGMFARPLMLSTEDGPASRWCVPPWLERARMSYRRADRWWPAPGRMDARGQWQEAVAQAGDEGVAWAATAIREHAA